jgi:predicted CopG family antitoxin
MKTITLTDEAYERLKDWKMGPRDSFSSVVLRLVPKRGTLADMLESFKQLPPLTEQQAEIMAEEVNWTNDWGNLEQPSSLWSTTSERSSESF